MKNIFYNLPDALHNEAFDTLLQQDRVRIERIVSCGQATPAGEWLESLRDEWVIVLAGSASVLFESDVASHDLEIGDYLFIPGLTRHRVQRTEQDTKTVWLAVYC